MSVHVQTLAELSQIQTPIEVAIGPVLVLAVRDREFRKSKRPFRSVRVRDNTMALNLNSYVCSSPLYTRLEMLTEEMIIDAIGKWNPEYPSIELHDFAVREDVSPSVFVDNRLKQQVTQQLESLIHSMTDPSCHQLLSTIFACPERKERFLSSPASRSNHHAYPSGLAVHTLEVVDFVSQLSGSISKFSCDWAVTCALLHDIGNIFVYDFAGDYTAAGKLKGHVILGYDMVTRIINGIPNFPEKLCQELEHSLLSHMGKVTQGYGSSVDPVTIIAILVHKMDELSADLAQK